jgi:hypothetical protein
MMANERALASYEAFLATRDGEADLARHSLPGRDDFFAALAAHPVRSTHRIDREVYLRNVVRARPGPGLDQRMLWVLASAKANQAERFAVGLTELYGRVTPEESSSLEVHLQLQETYHTRILADVVDIFGLPVPLRPPPIGTRIMIGWLLTVPERWRLPVAGMAEMSGCIVFRALRDRGTELFADERAVAERIRLLYDEILADEISHVGFIAARLAARGRAVMRALYRSLGRRLVSQMPELAAVVGRARLATAFAAPFRLDAMAAEFPGRAHVAALP